MTGVRDAERVVTGLSSPRPSMRPQGDGQPMVPRTTGRLVTQRRTLRVIRRRFSPRPFVSEGMRGLPPEGNFQGPGAPWPIIASSFPPRPPPAGSSAASGVTRRFPDWSSGRNPKKPWSLPGLQLGSSFGRFWKLIFPPSVPHSFPCRASPKEGFVFILLSLSL